MGSNFHLGCKRPGFIWFGPNWPRSVKRIYIGIWYAIGQWNEYETETYFQIPLNQNKQSYSECKTHISRTPIKSVTKSSVVHCTIVQKYSVIIRISVNWLLPCTNTKYLLQHMCCIPTALKSEVITSSSSQSREIRKRRFNRKIVNQKIIIKWKKSLTRNYTSVCEYIRVLTLGLHTN